MARIGLRCDTDKVLLVVNSSSPAAAVSEAAADYYISARGLTPRKLHFPLGNNRFLSGLRPLPTPATTGLPAELAALPYIDTVVTCTTPGPYFGLGFFQAIAQYTKDNAITAVIMSAATPAYAGYSPSLLQAYALASFVSFADELTYAAANGVYFDTGARLGWRRDWMYEGLDGPPGYSTPSGLRYPGAVLSLPWLSTLDRPQLPHPEVYCIGRLGCFRSSGVLSDELLSTVQRIVTDALIAENRNNFALPHVISRVGYGSSDGEENSSVAWMLAAHGVPTSSIYQMAANPDGIAWPSGVQTMSGFSVFPKFGPSSPPVFAAYTVGAPSGDEPTETGVGPAPMWMPDSSFSVGAYHMHYGSGTRNQSEPLTWLGKGVAGTWNQFEPLEPNIPLPNMFVPPLLSGATVGEAMMTTDFGTEYCIMVGDPLYAPYRIGRQVPNYAFPATINMRTYP